MKSGALSSGAAGPPAVRFAELRLLDRRNYW